jgi:hypothetical protein
MKNGAFSTGVVLPSTLVLCLAADAVLRTVPLDPFAFRAWEAVTRYRAPDAPFAADKVFRTSRAYGDLASLGNLPGSRQYRNETFTTDDWGYRNLPAAHSSAPPEGLLVGTSFSAGLSVNDDETLSVLTGRSMGRVLYNAAGQAPEVWRIRKIARRLGMTHGVVLYEYLERNHPPEIPDSDAPPPKPPLERAFDRVGLEGAFRAFEGWTSVSPLEVLAARDYKRLKDDRLLPRDPSGVIERRLRSEDTMLFLRYESTTLYEHRSRGDFVPYWRWLRRELADDGLDLLVILVPSKYTVYGDLLEVPDPRVGEGVSLFNRVERGLRDSGIMVANLAGPLRRAAAAGIGDRRYVYWRDDTHWNAAGISVGASEVARVWTESEARRSRE